jgi:peptidoglycan/LPS O-acetylase OafA/YrhL
MRRIRLSTFMLSVVIAALSVALVEQRRRAARREIVLEARLAEANAVVAKHYKLGIVYIDGTERMIKRVKEKGGR